MKRLFRLLIIVGLSFLFTNEGRLHDPPPVYMGEFDGVKIWHSAKIEKKRVKLDSVIQFTYGKEQMILDYIEWEKQNNYGKYLYNKDKSDRP